MHASYGHAFCGRIHHELAVNRGLRNGLLHWVSSTALVIRDARLVVYGELVEMAYGKVGLGFSMMVSVPDDSPRAWCVDTSERGRTL